MKSVIIYSKYIGPFKMASLLHTHNSSAFILHTWSGM